MTTPVGCTLYVDGARVADGAPADPDAAPTALSGLSVSWGRGTTIDQVEPSTCSFELMDPAGGSSFLDLLYTGARIDVTAAGVLPAAGVPVNIGGDFEQAAPGSVPPFTGITPAGAATITATRAHGGAQSAALTPTGRYAWADIPPAPPSIDPSAWDHYPTAVPGQTWTFGVYLIVPAGGYVNRTAVLYPGPNGAAAPSGGAASTRYDPAAPSWRAAPLSWTAPAGSAGKWPGLRVTVALAVWDTIWGYPAGTAWSGLGAESWADWGVGYLDDVTMAPPAGPAAREVTVFSGRVTDLSAGWEFQGPGAVVCSVTAADFTADLAQRDVGAAPWPAETLAARFAHIVTAAGVAIPYTIAPTLRNWRISWLDVDRQQAMPLLQDLATSVDGVLWSATHRTTGPYLWLADPRVNSALYVLQEGPDGLVHVVPTEALDSAIEMDACDVLLEPVVFKQSVSDVSTRVSITWQDQTVDDGGLPSPTERTDVVVDADLEEALGTRSVSVSTLLTTADDALAVATLILARLSLQSWRVGGLTWETDATDGDGGMTPDQVGRALDLLDGTRRLTAPILLSNLPTWTPSGGATLQLLLQGGTYTYEGGQWTLELTTSSAAAQGTSLAWQDLDTAWAWTEFDPGIAWTDLYGVTTPTEGP